MSQAACTGEHSHGGVFFFFFFSLAAVQGTVSKERARETQASSVTVEVDGEFVLGLCGSKCFGLDDSIFQQ